MSRIVTIGDIHGKSIWKEIVEKELNKSDKIIFIGDYLDSFEYSAEQMAQNFLDILYLKRENPDKIVLLHGNHDFSYYTEHTCSGYNYLLNTLVSSHMKNAVGRERMQMLYEEDGVLYSHAGITKTFHNELLRSFDMELEKDYSIVDFYNDCLKNSPRQFQFRGGWDSNPYGDNVYQGPLWVRPNSLLLDRIEDYKQVVGHTHQKEITYHPDEKVCFIDCLDSVNEYAVIEDGKISSRKLDL